MNSKKKLKLINFLICNANKGDKKIQIKQNKKPTKAIKQPITHNINIMLKFLKYINIFLLQLILE